MDILSPILTGLALLFLLFSITKPVKVEPISVHRYLVEESFAFSGKMFKYDTELYISDQGEIFNISGVKLVDTLCDLGAIKPFLRELS